MLPITQYVINYSFSFLFFVFEIYVCFPLFHTMVFTFLDETLEFLIKILKQKQVFEKCFQNLAWFMKK